MKKYFVFSDPHGFYTEMMKSLIDSGFSLENPEHIIIICGDILDRGTEVKEMIDFVYSMLKQDRAILIRGNHEDLFDQMVGRRYFDRNVDIPNGTLLSLYQLAHLDEKPTTPDEKHYMLYRACSTFYDLLSTYDKRWDAIKVSMLNFYETKNYIFVHGWIPSIELQLNKNVYDPEWRMASSGEWRLARWDNGMKMASLGVIEPNKTIVCGHWHAAYGNVRKKYPDKTKDEYEALEWDKENIDLFKTYTDKGIIALDSCTVYTHFVNVLVIDESDI